MATHMLTGSRERAHVPNPLTAAAPLILLAVVALALEAAPDLPWEVGVAVAGMFGAAGLARLAQRWLELRQLRRVADGLILRGTGQTTTSPLVAWRTLELTSGDHRRRVAAEAARLTRELDAGTLPGAVPLNRAAVRPFRRELEELAGLLAADEAVCARGVLLAEQLLTSPASPLYDRDAAGTLGTQLRRVQSALRP